MVRTSQVLSRQLNAYLYRRNQRNTLFYECRRTVCDCRGSAYYLRHRWDAVAWAIDRQRTSTFRRALSLGIIPHQNLSAVVKSGHLPIIHHYLRSCAFDVDAVDPEGCTALYWAVAKSKHFRGIELARTLIETHGAQLNYPIDYFDKMPLFEACRLGHSSMASLLIKHGAWVNPPEYALNRMKETHQVSTFNKFLPSEDNRGPHAGVVSTRAKCDHTPLQMASRYGHTHICEILMGHGASVRGTSISPGWTPLHSATLGASPDVVKLLLQTGAHERSHAMGLRTLAIPNFAIDASGMDVANEGARIKDWTECIRLLLRAGLRLYSTCQLLWNMAENQKKMANVITLLLHYDSALKPFEGSAAHWTKVGPWEETDSRQLLLMAMDRSLDVANLFLRAGFDMDQLNDDGDTLLYQLAEEDNAPLCRFLAAAGANTGWQREDTGFGAVHIAANLGSIHVLRVMVKDPLFNMASADNLGRTPLFHAARKGYYECLVLILSRGRAVSRKGWDMSKADLSEDVPDAFGTRPVIAAARNGHMMVVRVLLMVNPANLLAQDAQGRDVLFWANVNPNLKMRKMVLEFARRRKISI
ncbi:ankyrin repeat-containing domain protein [Emericellopsis atlantica]|uniref:Ankyrin repeat-containing domain protein n=1 Tax=Emericellopsis atlantica TaxID=2614577 RepID=A0A9P7ZLB6_9HYPO|nr:ankyrin repeat-containing domain protein [Emericellopsis atlantica]KAG9254214.1 ankyrin repeat-containing domain protein [Emericellopsis atlantica]